MGTISLAVMVYGLTLWFGLYLLSRDFSKLGLRYTGLGLISYAASLAITMLASDQSAWFYLPYILPSAFWLMASFYLIPDVPVQRSNIITVAVILVIGIVAWELLFINEVLAKRILFLIPIGFLLGAAWRIRQAWGQDLPKSALLLSFTGMLMFALASGLLVLPVEILSATWAILAISADILLLGISVAVLDAYDEGTTLRVDALRSLLGIGAAVVILGGQILGVMAITEDTSTPLTFLLFSVVTVTIVMLTLGDQFQALLDAIAYADRPTIKNERETLRAASVAVTRIDSTHEFSTMSDKEFTRLTRRALSHYADLDKLAASPLTRLPLITERLGDNDNVLARANELKALLREAINQLKPVGEADFDSTDEWRYYNVLYFPYVVGIKPFSRRYFADDLDDATQAALNWMQTYVPERTLYNWQNTAAGLIAQYIRDQL